MRWDSKLKNNIDLTCMHRNIYKLYIKGKSVKFYIIYSSYAKPFFKKYSFKFKVLKSPEHGLGINMRKNLNYP